MFPIGGEQHYQDSRRGREPFGMSSENFLAYSDLVNDYFKRNTIPSFVVHPPNVSPWVTNSDEAAPTNGSSVISQRTSMTSLPPSSEWYRVLSTSKQFCTKTPVPFTLHVTWQILLSSINVYAFPLYLMGHMRLFTWLINCSFFFFLFIRTGFTRPFIFIHILAATAWWSSIYVEGSHVFSKDIAMLSRF